MKKFLTIALVLVLTLGLLAGCGKKEPEMTTTAPSATTAAPTTRPTTAPTTRPTTAPTTAPTAPSTGMTGPDMEQMIPGGEDTVDPSGGEDTVNPNSGANQETGGRSRTTPRY